MGTLSDKTKSGEFGVEPNTTTDQENLEKWEYGDDVKGTFANSVGAFRRYRRDIERAYGKEADYDKNIIYIDTFSEDGIGAQLEEYK